MSDSLMPPRLFHGSPRNSSMDTLVHALRSRDEDIASGFWGEDPPWLLGTVIPPFQRPLVWDQERMEKFIQSAWLGMHLGHFVYNDLSGSDEPTWRDDAGRERFHRTDRWLIDGQQRLSAVDGYLRNQFPVFGHFYDELGPREKRRFDRIPFGSETVSMTSEHDLRILYDRMNFGGVAHAPEQRATTEDDSGFETAPLPRR